MDLNLYLFKRAVRPRNFERIVLVSLVSIPLVIACVHGIDRPFNQEPDAGITWVYQTILVTDGKPQTSTDHSGYLHFLLMGGWYLLLKFLGFVSASSLSDILQAPVPREAFIELVGASRVFSGIFVGLIGAIFFLGLKSLTENRTIATVASLILVVTTGFVEQAIRIHTELFSALFAYTALFLILAASRTSRIRGFIWLGLAATASVLALLSKLQALPLLLSFPLIALAFGSRPVDPFFDPLVRASSGSVLVASASCLAISTIPLAMLIATLAAFDGFSTVLHPQIFQLFVISYIIISIGVYCFFYRPHWKTTLLGYTSVSAGVSIGVFFLFVNHLPELFQIMVNYVNHMNRYAVTRLDPHQTLTTENYEILKNILQNLVGIFGETIARSFTFGLGRENLITPLYWMLVVGGFWACIKREWSLGVRLLLFLSIALGMEMFCRLRYLATWYYIYFEPWVIIGNALFYSGLIEYYKNHSQYRRVKIGLFGAYAFGLISAPGIISDAFVERDYRLEESHCDRPYHRAPKVPNLVCFE